MEVGEATLCGFGLVLLQVALEFISGRKSSAVGRREIIDLEDSVVRRRGRLTMRHRHDKELRLKLFHSLSLAQESGNHIVGSGIARCQQLSALMVT
jgi:hypothetical protein